MLAFKTGAQKLKAATVFVTYMRDTVSFFGSNMSDIEKWLKDCYFINGRQDTLGTLAVVKARFSITYSSECVSGFVFRTQVTAASTRTRFSKSLSRMSASLSFKKVSRV